MEQLKSTSQKMFSHAIESNLKDQILSNAESERDKARLNAVSMRHSGDWLNTVPVKALGLHLQSVEFITAVKYRLGVAVYPSSGLCKACNKESDKFGDHAVGCPFEGERIYRHNSLRDCVHSTAKTAALSPAKEEASLLPGSADKPADVFLPGWANGRHAALDVTVVSPLQVQLRKKAAEEKGSATNKRYDEKNTMYRAACEREGIQFFPLVVETFGGWHPNSEVVITKLAKQLAAHTGNNPSEVTSHVYQRLGILLPWGNSALITTRTPVFADPMVDGVLDM